MATPRGMLALVLVLAAVLCQARSAVARDGLGLSLVEAVTLALEHDPNIQIVAAEVLVSEGALLVASGRFDPVVSAGVSQDDARATAVDEGSATTSTLEGSVALSKELRTGLTLEPSVELTRVDAAGPDALNRSTVRFTLRQPLLRDRGRHAVAAEEDAAGRELEASRLDLEHTIARRIVEVASGYWRLEAARRSLEIAEASEETSRRLLATTRKLVAADVTPAADVVLLEADLAAKEATRIATEQQLLAAHRDLGREIGLDHEGISSLGLPSDPFPAIPPGDVPVRLDEGGLIELALARRADLRAAHGRQEAGRLREGGARNALEPRLDLLVVPSYSGAVEGNALGRFVDPLYEGGSGLGTTVGLSFSWPTLNRAAEGRLLRARAQLEQSELDVELLVKQIGADVPTALDAVRRSAQRLVKASVAVGLFARAVENEQKKLRAGRSTLIDVITQQDRLTAARQSEVSARLALAQALVDLRFQTGTIVAGDGRLGATDRRRLTTLPSPGDG